jgi:hypothetical protein
MVITTDGACDHFARGETDVNAKGDAKLDGTCGTEAWISSPQSVSVLTYGCFAAISMSRFRSALEAAKQVMAMALRGLLTIVRRRMRAPRLFGQILYLPKVTPRRLSAMRKWASTKPTALRTVIC